MTAPRSEASGAAPRATSTFAQNVAKITGGTAVAQVIAALAMIALARLYSPAEFGLFSTLLAVATIAGLVSTLRYDMAIPLAADDDEAYGLSGLCFASSAALSLVCTAGAMAVGIANDSISLLDSALLGASVFAVGFWTTARSLATRMGQYQAVATSSVWGTTVQSGTQIAFGIPGLGASGLLAGYAMGRAGNGALLWNGRVRGHVLRDHRKALRTWIRFPLLSLPPALLNALSVSAVAPILVALFDVTVAGLFAFTSRVMALPSVLITQAVGAVLFPEISRMAREGRPVHAHLERLARTLALLALPTFGLTWLFGEELFALVFGEQWRRAGIMAVALSPWLAANFVSSPLSSYMTVANRLGLAFAMSVGEFIVRIAALGVGAAIGDPMLSVWAYSASGVLISIVFLVVTLRQAGGGVRSAIRGRSGLMILVSLMVLALAPVIGTGLPARSDLLIRAMAMALVIGMVGCGLWRELTGRRAMR